MIINETDAQLLIESIDAAKGMRSCKYTTDGQGTEPCCVIGQYAYRKGVSLDQMKKWDTLEKNSIYKLYKNVPELQSVPVLILDKLQTIWDLGRDEKLLKVKMKILIERFVNK